MSQLAAQGQEFDQRQQKHRRREEHPGNGARLQGIHVESLAHGGQGQRNIGAVDERDGVHDRRHRQNANQALVRPG